MDTRFPIKTILLDMDGVLWRGPEPILNILGLFNQIRSMGCLVYCVTNNSTHTVDSYLEKFQNLGVELSSDQIITSAEAAALYLADRFPEKGSVFTVGEIGLNESLIQKGFKIAVSPEQEDLIAVAVGLDRNLTYQKIDQAAQAIVTGKHFIGTNPDQTIPAPNGTAPGAGAVISAIEAASGQKAFMIGKPEKHLFALALSRSGSSAAETIMLGDRLDTDIWGAQKMGIKTGLVLSGISTRRDGENWDPAPDIIADNALAVLEKLQ